MARPIYETQAAQRFRQTIAPALVANGRRAEIALAMRAADELFNWLQDVVVRALQVSDLRDDKGKVRKHLLGGVRTSGRANLRSLRGYILADPWVFPHEYGAVIEAKNSRYLTIPIGYALRPDGSPKFRSASSWKRFGSFIYKPRGGEKKFIAYKTPGGELRLLYVLEDEVDIPERLGLNQMGNSMLGTLLGQWGLIFTQILSGYIINPWER